MIKKSLLVGATIATVTLGGGGLALAATDTTNGTEGNGASSLVEKIAAKFNLKQTEVQAVFDEEREARHAEKHADFEERLSDAVKDQDITQEQADHIKAVRAEIDKLRGDSNPRELSDDVRDQIHDKMEELRDWAEENDIEMRYVMGGKGMGGHGRGGIGVGHDN